MLDQMLRQHQVDQNYENFRRLMPELLRDHPGKYAVMREGIVIKFFDTFCDAIHFARVRYTNSNYSIEEVTGRSTEAYPVESS
jgi:hypothetical protein